MTFKMIKSIMTSITRCCIKHRITHALREDIKSIKTQKHFKNWTYLSQNSVASSLQP